MYRRFRYTLRFAALLLLLSVSLSCIACVTETERPAYLPIPVPSAEQTEPETDPPTPKKRVALTFDDGPNHYADRTKSIVDELEKYGFHATFFVVGNRVAGGNALAYAVEKGNEIGIHGYTHEVYYNECSEDEFRRELNRTEQAIKDQLPGYQVKLMRPIGGSITDHRVKTCPYAVIHWSVDSLDYTSRYYTGISDEEAEACVQKIVDTIMSDVSDGDIILMHDIYESSADAVKLLLPLLAAEGYEVVTVSELLGDNLTSGRIYYSAST